MRIPPDQATEEIDHGIEAVETARTCRDQGAEHALLSLSRLRVDARGPSISCNRAASWCSAPISGPATGIR